MPPSLSVKVGADVSDLNANLSRAQASVRSFADNSRAIDAALSGQHGSLTDAMAAYDRELRTSAATAATTASSMRVTGASAHALGGSLSTATREFRALFDELSSGRTRMIPGTLAIIGQRVLGMGPASLAAVGGVAVLAAGLGTLAIEAVKAENALDQAAASARFAGNEFLTQSQLASLTDDLASFGHMSTSTAREVVAAFAGIRNETTPLVQALAAEVGDYAQVTGQEAPKAAEALTRAFADPLAEGKKFLNTIPGVTQAQLDAFAAAQKQGNANAAAALMVTALDAALNRARGTLDEHNAGMFASLKNFGAYIGLLNSGMSVEEAETAVLKDQNGAREKQADLLQKAVAALKATPSTPEQTLRIGVSTAEDDDKQGARTEKLRGDIEKMTAALEVARSRGDQLNVDRLERGLAAARHDLDEIAGGNALERFRTSLSEMEANWNGTHTDMLRESVRMWADETKAADLNAKEKIAVEKGYADAKRALNQAVTQESLAISRSDAQADLSISRMKVDAKRADLDLEVQANEITAAQKRAIIRQLSDDEYNLNLKSLEDQLATLQKQPVEYERVYNQIRELKARHELDMASIDRQAAVDAKKQANEQAKAWKDAVGEIGFAETGLVRDAMAGRMTLTQAALRMSSQLLTGEIANDLKYLTMKGLYSVLGLQMEQKAATGGLLVHALTEQRKTAATVAGSQARSAAEVSENGGLITRIGDALARWFGFETAKTGATVAGATARGTAEEGVAAASIATDASLALARINISAAVAAAAAFADSAELGPPGLAAAPAAADAAYVATASWAAGLVGLDVGAYQVPQDMVARIHKDEMVVPATFASGLRTAMSGGGGKSGGSATGDTHIHIHAIDAQSFIERIHSVVPTIVRAVNGYQKNNISMAPA